MKVTMIKDDEVGPIEAAYEASRASAYQIGDELDNFEDKELGKCRIFSATCKEQGRDSPRNTYLLVYEDEDENPFTGEKKKSGVAIDLFYECYVPNIDGEFVGDQLLVFDYSDAEDDGEDDPMDLANDTIETDKRSEIEDAEEGIGGTLRSCMSVQVPDDKVPYGAEPNSKKLRFEEQEGELSSAFAEPAVLKKVELEKKPDTFEPCKFFAKKKSQGQQITRFPDKNTWMDACILSKKF